MADEPNGGGDSLGWRAGLPDTLKQDSTFTPYKTVGEFAQSHLDTVKKVKDLETRLGDSIPKLPDNATDEDRSAYYEALGRPKTAQEYEFDGEDKNAPEWTNFWKTELHKRGLTKQQAKEISGLWNGQMKNMVDSYNSQRQQEMQAAEQKLRNEMGDKFDTNVELAKRMATKHLGTEFDKEFANADPASRFGIVRLLLKVAQLTGEDRSPQTGNSLPNGKANTFINYDKSPAPPHR